MNSKSLRRLAADHGSLQTAGLPPNYLFPPAGASDPYSDLTSLDILLAGPVGTPYANGVWRLHLDIPPNYPTAPPTATFRTPLWHPNIDEKSGAVCVETLKRDWSSSLKLRDVLVTISCLLIQPNPASALNEDAGKLASEDWDGFCRRATLMTKIHASVPASLAEEVKEAQSRGEDKVEKSEKNTKVEVMDAESKVNGKGKGRDSAKTTTSNASKVIGSSKEDEENTKGPKAAVTVDAESDPEADWIPGPIKSPKVVSKGRGNIFGIQGLDDQLQLDSPQRVRPSGGKVSDYKTNDKDRVVSDPFITVPAKRTAQQQQQQQQSFSLRGPASTISDPSIAIPPTDTPDSLKYSTKNPFSAIQLNNQERPLIKEFSWSWTDSEAIHGSGLASEEGRQATGSLEKDVVKKRMASEEFQEKQRWEAKRFKRAGYDLKRYNRGDFGPRMGIARL